MSLKPMNRTVCDLGGKDAEANDMSQEKARNKTKEDRALAV